jgi:hypothetical protein
MKGSRFSEEQNRRYDRVNRVGSAPLRCGNALHRQIDPLLAPVAWHRGSGSTVNEWLAAHPRVHLHFTPSSASWLNLVERWCAIITGHAIRRGSFDSVRRLEAAIMNWLSHWNDNAKPFRWTKSAADIRRSIRNAALIDETRH